MRRYNTVNNYMSSLICCIKEVIVFRWTKQRKLLGDYQEQHSSYPVHLNYLQAWVRLHLHLMWLLLLSAWNIVWNIFFCRHFTKIRQPALPNAAIPFDKWGAGHLVDLSVMGCMLGEPVEEDPWRFTNFWDFISLPQNTGMHGIDVLLCSSVSTCTVFSIIILSFWASLANSSCKHGRSFHATGDVK